MKAPYPSLTAEWHNDTYAAIDPERPELSVKGKKVVISGGGAGIGRTITQAFADAGATSIAILGRREPMLLQTKQTVTSKHGDVSVSVHAADVTDLAAMKKAAKEIGSWDILVSNAGYMSTPASVVDSDAAEWWKAFEVNVKGSFNLTQAFLPTRNEGSTIISINAGSVQVPVAYIQNQTAYNSSKIATLKFFEILGAENRDVHIVSMHPGVVDTDMFQKGNMRPPSMDSPELAAHFAVWLCSEEAKFLRGRFVWANWNVTELIEKKSDIESSLMLTANCVGWPFAG